MLLRVIFLLLFILLPCQAFSSTAQYNLVYIWDKNLDTVLDYQNQLEEILGPGIAGSLRVVGREQGDYGLIFEHGGTTLSSAQLMVRHSEMLNNAGLPACSVVDDQKYYPLYNVSYGLGPNLESLKKQYHQVYRLLGSEVGKNLFIEQTGGNNYTLIYRRRGDRSSTYAVAGKHAKLLKKNKISTTIIAEKNNPVVFGESSHLDDAIALEIIDILRENELEEKTGPALTEFIEISDPAKIARAPSGPTSKEVEQVIEKFIKELRKKGSISSDERTSWMVFDLTRKESLAAINGDLEFQAASMIKPFVALAFFHRVKNGELKYGPESRRKMEQMIQYSNNEATNWVMRMVGGPSRCNDILRTHYGDIFKNTLITEYIPPGGKTYKNLALPSDYVRFLQALWDDELPNGKEIRRLMSLPGRDRLYDNTPIPKGTLVYNKTGSTAFLCGDMGILVPRDKDGNSYPYALVGIIQRGSRPNNYGDWMLTRGNVIREVSTLVYQELKKQYQLL